MIKRLVVYSIVTLAPLPAVAQRITAPDYVASCQFEDEGGLLQGWARKYYSLRKDEDSKNLRDEIVKKLQPCHLDFSRPHSIVFPIPEVPVGFGYRFL